MALAEILKERRNALNLTLEQLSALTGLSKSYVNKLENGHLANPSVEKLTSLCNVLGLDPSALSYAVFRNTAGVEKPKRDLQRRKPSETAHETALRSLAGLMKTDHLRLGILQAMVKANCGFIYFGSIIQSSETAHGAPIDQDVLDSVLEAVDYIRPGILAALLEAEVTGLGIGRTIQDAERILGKELEHAELVSQIRRLTAS